MKDPIVHHDLKNGNIMFDDVYDVPIMIDFGLSFTRSELFESPLNIKTLDKIFYIYYEKYPAWNITQSIALKGNININEQIVKPYYSDLLKVVDDFVREGSGFETDEDRVLFTVNTKDYLSNFENKP
jgi:serine/threonine protein kinase